MIRILCRLLRPRLSVLNGIAALGGGMLFPGEPAPWPLAASLCGVTLLAAGGSAINQVQEREIDRLMVRTRLRPLPRGDLAPLAASVIGVGCILAGLTVLAAAGGILPSLLGAAALVWYLGVYTPLKRRTTLALAVGALCGAFPPVIGWVVAGGAPGDFRVVLLGGLLYLWQVPHFWLFQRKHADDYRRAGIMQFGSGTAGAASAVLCRLWIAALSAAAMLLPAFGILERRTPLVLAPFFLLLLAACPGRFEPVLFRCLNLLPFVVVGAIFMQKG